MPMEPSVAPRRPSKAAEAITGRAAHAPHALPTPPTAHHGLAPRTTHSRAALGGLSCWVRKYAWVGRWYTSSRRQQACNTAQSVKGPGGGEVQVRCRSRNCTPQKSFRADVCGSRSWTRVRRIIFKYRLLVRQDGQR